jgi:hypothetical protein
MPSAAAKAFVNTYCTYVFSQYGHDAIVPLGQLCICCWSSTISSYRVFRILQLRQFEQTRILDSRRGLAHPCQRCCSFSCCWLASSSAGAGGRRQLAKAQSDLLVLGSRPDIGSPRYQTSVGAAPRACNESQTHEKLRWHRESNSEPGLARDYPPANLGYRYTTNFVGFA